MIIQPAYGKVNLALEVIGRRPDVPALLARTDLNTGGRARLDQHLALAARQHDAADPDPAALRHRLADHSEGLGGELTIRIHVIWRVEIDRIDFIAVDCFNAPSRERPRPRLCR